MNKYVIIIFLAFLTFKVHSQSEISLFDKNGNPVAYIDVNDEWTIYLWQGNPVAYIIQEEQTLHIYGFNGKHLGWYDNGILRDHKGDAVGFKKGAVSSVYENFEGFKGYKEYKPYKLYREIALYRVYYSRNFSSVSLSSFLFQGINTEETRSNYKVYDAPDPIMETDLDLMVKINLRKQKIFDQNSKSIQNIINETSYYLDLIYKYDKIEYKKQLEILNNNVNLMNSKRIDFSNTNHYNQIITPLKNNLSFIKSRLKLLQSQ